jgi:DNA (cytosine-5)-methyltransferase 1
MVQTHVGEGQPRYATLRDAIKHLQGTAMDAQNLDPSVVNSMQYIPAGGDWRSIPVEFQSPWVLKTMKTKGSTNWFPRSAWHEPARTLTTMVGVNKASPHCHPHELRALSVEECAAIQTFPPGFLLAGSRRQKYRQTGNAVPVKFAQAVAEPLKLHMARQLPPWGA